MFIRKEEMLDSLLRVQADFGAPVGGLTILRHFEVNCGPITARLSRGVIVAVFEFFQPPEGSDQSQVNRANFLTSPGDIQQAKARLLGAAAATGGGGGKIRAATGKRGSKEAINIAPQANEWGAGGGTANPDNDIRVLKKRAMRNIVFKHFRFGEVNIYLSYSGETSPIYLS